MPCHLIARNNNSNIRRPNEPSNKNCHYIDRRIPFFASSIYMYHYYYYLCENLNNSSRRFPTPPGVRLIGLDNRDKLKDISLFFLFFHISLLRGLCYTFVCIILCVYIYTFGAKVHRVKLRVKGMMVVPLECEL